MTTSAGHLRPRAGGLLQGLWLVPGEADGRTYAHGKPRSKPAQGTVVE
jgi:hypothetical protein